jgi:hypothetical protein
MAPTSYQPLIAGHVYELGSQLLEACPEGDTWRLYVLNGAGEYVTAAQGRLMGYELRTDGSGAWDRLHYVQVAPIWPSWAFLRGATIQIDADALTFVAESRGELQAVWIAEDEQFWELMSEFSWDMED